MTKSATVQARVDIVLKRQADMILKNIGMTASQVVNALYAQIVMCKGIPFELKIPNKATLTAIHELEHNKGKPFASFDEMIRDVEHNHA